MKEAKRCLLCIFVLALSLACDNRYVNKPNQKRIPGDVGPDLAISFGSPVELFRVVITRVQTEVVPYKAVGGKDIKIGPTDFNYKISATAEFTIALVKPGFTAFEKLQSKMKFELITSSGVVLAAEEVPIRFHRNQTEGTASVNLIGLSEFDIEKASYVRASWVYGR